MECLWRSSDERCGAEERLARIRELVVGECNVAVHVASGCGSAIAEEQHAVHVSAPETKLGDGSSFSNLLQICGF
jgi:hypothetical protein